jgi:hypothetical protein
MKTIILDPPLDAESIKKAFPIGCTVELLDDDSSDISIGSKGTIIGYFSQIGVLCGEVWLMIRWFPPTQSFANESSGWAPYGPYSSKYHRFKILGSTPSIEEKQPRNNDNRKTCFWCSAPTRKAGGGAYDVCTICGR